MILLAISSPSGAGKSTIIKALLDKFDDLYLSISVTTRLKREGEIDGFHYYFKSIEQFKNMQKDNLFIETAFFCNNYYGTLKSEIEKAKNSNKRAIIFDIDIDGFKQLKNNIKSYDIVSIFILPPSMKILEERLRMRKTDSEDAIKLRLTKAKEEILHAKEYDFQIVNDDINISVSKICDIYKKYT